MKRSKAGYNIVGFATSKGGILDASKITSKGQLTLPKTVRKILSVSEGDSVRFVSDDGRVIIEACESETVDDDPVVGRFLAFLEHDLSTRPGAAMEFPPSLLEAARKLTEGVEVSLDDPIEGDVEL